MTTPESPAINREAPSPSAAADDASDALVAGLATAVSLPAAQVIKDYSMSTLGEVSLGKVLHSLEDHAGTIKGGDLSRVESMLGGQATALNTMFAELARRGAVNMGQYMGAAETYLKLALRAQNQCRATLETLAAIKNPPVIFAKQANIAHGHQQVNNGTAVPVAHAEQTDKPPTELLEHDHGQWLDTGTTRAAGRGNPSMEAVAIVKRPAHPEGKGTRKP